MGAVAQRCCGATVRLPGHVPPLKAPPRLTVFRSVRVPCRVVHVVDGDTVHVVTRASDGEPWAQYTVRLQGVDTPESKGPTARERAVAGMVTEYMQQVVGRGADTVGVLVTGKATDKYGRLLGDVCLPHLPGGLGAHALARGLGRAYNGRAKGLWTDEELTAIVHRLKGTVPGPVQGP